MERSEECSRKSWDFRRATIASDSSSAISACLECRRPASLTAGGSGMPDYQLDRSEQDWSGLCRHANGRDDFWFGSPAH